MNTMTPSRLSFPQIVLASRNVKKCDEIRALLSPAGVPLIGVGELDGGPEIVEDGESFAENAAKKAVETAMHFSKWAIGEDSGLRVDALNGAPGIYSARYSGPEATDASNNAKLIRELGGVPPERRGAQYVCHVALSDPSGNARLSVEATCRGRITSEPHGTNGFGYDPFFEICEYHRTFGELSPLVKQCLSHRARAFAKLAPQLGKLFSE
jgi:XTP/dITP diphosphohydrolase